MILSTSRKHLEAFELVAKKVKRIEHEPELNSLIDSILNRAKDTPLILSFLNAHGLNLAVKSESFLKTLNISDLLLRDGFGMQILYRSLKLKEGLNLNGTDLIPKLLSHAKHENFKVYLIGTSTKNLQLARHKLIALGVPTTVIADGFKNFSYYLEKIPQTSPENRLFLLGMGMPKQEELSILLKKHIDNGLIINGGAFIDFQSGEITRAPYLFRKLGLEWLYRLFYEPRRLFSRYVFGNIIFLCRIPLILKIQKYTITNN